MQLEQGTPIIDVQCPICEGDVTLITGETQGKPLKGKCTNKMDGGKACGTWFTAGANPSYLLKQQFIKEQTESQSNDSEENSTLSTEENSTETPQESTTSKEENTSTGTEEGTSTGTEEGTSTGTEEGTSTGTEEGTSTGRKLSRKAARRNR